MNIARSDSLTKQKLLDAAQELMLAKGYTATSVDEICEAARLTKGSFFHYFEGKEHLEPPCCRQFLLRPGFLLQYAIGSSGLAACAAVDPDTAFWPRCVGLK